MISKFESMSNELLMELFEYYDLYSLRLSFDLLNSRIDNLLYHCQVHCDLDRIRPIDFIRFYAHILPQINPKNIRSLHASKSHYIMILAYDQSLVYFTHIRSLYLSDIPANMIEYMLLRMEFSSLERIILDNCHDKDTKHYSFIQHFLDSNRYRFLRTYKDFNSRMNNITSTVLLEYLTISNCNAYYLFNILDQSPYLKYIQTSLDFRARYLPALVFVFPRPCYYRLTHLCLHLFSYDGICMRTLDYLFQCIPRITNLKLSAQLERQSEYIDPVYWERFLSKYLVELQRLYLSMDSIDTNLSNNPIWNYLTNKESIIEQIHKSNYWSSHQWKATFNSSIPTHPGGLFWAKFTVVS